jgi:hypothetical protein
MEDDFKFIVPAEITKSTDGEWRVSGLASTSSVDKQGEVILPEGIDATPIAKGKGFFNFDHDNSPENTIGALDGYKKTATGMYVEGRLFKNHSRAKAVYEIMSSLNKGDKGRVGMSVEGKVIERCSKNPSIIKRCLIKNVALTLNPVNQDTYADIVKSMSSVDSVIEFDSTGEQSHGPATTSAGTFTAEQVIEIVQKALSAGAGYTQAPANLSGGAALGMEEFGDKKKKDDKKSKLVKKSADLYKSSMLEMLDKLQTLYPQNSRSEIWNAVKDRMETRFPDTKNEEL